MNTPQRLVLITGILAVLLTCLFPPWLLVFDPPSGSIYQKAARPAGYHLITSPHMATDPTELAKIFALDSATYQSRPLRYPVPNAPLSSFSVIIDKERLAVQLIGIVLATGMLCLVLSRKHQHS